MKISILNILLVLSATKLNSFAAGRDFSINGEVGLTLVGWLIVIGIPLALLFIGIRFLLKSWRKLK